MILAIPAHCRKVEKQRKAKTTLLTAATNGNPGLPAQLLMSAVRGTFANASAHLFLFFEN